MADRDVRQKNAKFYANRAVYDKFVSDFASMKKDVAKIEDAYASYARDQEEEDNIEMVRQLLTNMQVNSNALPAARRRVISKLLTETGDITNKLLTQKHKYQDAKNLKFTYERKTIPDLEKLLNPNNDVGDFLNKYKKLSASEQRAIETDREAFESLEQEFKNTVRTLKNLNVTEDMKRIIEIHRVVLQAYAKFLRRAGYKPAPAPSVRAAPKVAIFCKEYTPQYYAINSQTALTFYAKVKNCLKPTPRLRYDELCAKVGEPSHLTLAQQTPFYYTNPNNPTSILLNHSAGSGKTAAMTLAMSLFVRAG